MRAIFRRVGKLEDQYRTKTSPEVLRLIVSRADGTGVRLEKATCKRYFFGDGQLMEVINLNSSNQQITEEELDRFVENFPIS